MILCYFTSGLLKLLEEDWRNGKSLKGILLTETYSISLLKNIIKVTNPRILQVASYFIIFWEISFIYSPFMNINLLILFLLIGILFHLFIAIIMGLNTFLFTFLGCYPAIIYFNQFIIHKIHL
jgi:hypothetical protein